MRTLGTVVALLLAASTASADVTLIDPNIEVGGVYTHIPQAAFGAHAALVGTGVHVRDRNGLYAKIIAALIGGDCHGCDRTSSTYNLYDVRESPLGTFVTIRYAGTVTTEPESEESILAREAAQQEIGMGTNSYTEVTAYFPQSGTSNIHGGMFGIGAAAFGNAKYALDVGIRWSFIRADVCGDKADPTRCSHKFFGAPIDFLANLGPVELDLGVAWNWRNDASSAHGGLMVELGNRLFVRAGAEVYKGHGSDPMYMLEAGGRL